MTTWEKIGRLIAPIKHGVFWVLSRLHKTTRPRVVVRCEDEVLLVQNWGDGRWSLPGGGVHRHESLKQAALRELKEELGIETHLDQLVYHETIELPTYFAPIFSVRFAKRPSIIRQKFEISRTGWHGEATFPRETELMQKLRL